MTLSVDHRALILDGIVGNNSGDSHNHYDEDAPEPLVGGHSDGNSYDDQNE